MKRLIIAATLAFALLGGLVLAPTTLAQTADIYGACSADSDSTICKSRSNTADPIIENIVNILLMIVGTVSIIMIIVGGILFAVSNGDSSKITRARQTILYAVIGLVIALFSYAIVSFVFDKSTGATESSYEGGDTSGLDRHLSTPSEPGNSFSGIK